MTPDIDRKLLCSAGVSYFHVYPNGDVYRCQADYNGRRQPMFNLKHDGWKGAVDATVCDHPRCYNACDLDWTTKWQMDGRGQLERTIEGQAKDLQKEVSALLCSQRLEAPQLRVAYFIWSPTLACNYTCAYCGCATGAKRIKTDFPSSHPELTPEEWTRIWSEILERFDYGILSITGGEPLLANSTIPVLSLAARKFACYLASNLSRSILEFTRSRIRPGSLAEVAGLGQLPVGLCGINCSLHPTSKGFSWELFKGSVLLLRHAGFPVAVNYVGYPLQLYLAPEYQAWCDQNGVAFTLSSWQGTDNQGIVARYSLAELSFFEEIAPPHRKKANELVFMDCGYEVTFDSPVQAVLMGDTVRLTGRIRNLSSSPWLVGSGRWAVGGYLTHVGRSRPWLREMRTSPSETHVPPKGELAFAMDVDTSGLAAGIYEVWVDMLMAGRDWMALQGAVPASATLRVETFDYAIDLDHNDAVRLSQGAGTVLSGNLRNTCSRPWPAGAGATPLQLGARLFPRAAGDVPVREFRAPVDALPQAPEQAAPFRLVFDPGDLAPGEYELRIDVVKEGQFWLADRGATPRVIPVLIA